MLNLVVRRETARLLKVKLQNKISRNKWSRFFKVNNFRSGRPFWPFANKPSCTPDPTVHTGTITTTTTVPCPTLPAGCVLSAGCSTGPDPVESLSCRSCPRLRTAVAWRQGDHDVYCQAGVHLTYGPWGSGPTEGENTSPLLYDEENSFPPHLEGRLPTPGASTCNLYVQLHHTTTLLPLLEHKRRILIFISTRT
jgi:hypothetical protein